MRAWALIRFSHVQLLATLWTVAARLLYPWDAPGKNTGVGCHVLLQGNLPDPGIKLGSSALQVDSLPSEAQEKSTILELK